MCGKVREHCSVWSSQILQCPRWLKVEGKLGFAVKDYQAACERYCGVDSKEEVVYSLPIGYDNV